MTLINPNPIVVDLAAEFCRQLRKQLSTFELREAIALNAAEQDPQICHTHDFTDANEVMAEAYSTAVGAMPHMLADAAGQKALRLINSAWALAKAKQFDRDEVKAVMQR